MNNLPTRSAGVNGTLVVLALIAAGAWMIWQSFSAMSAETRSFLNGLLTGTVVTLIALGLAVIALATQYARIVGDLRRQLEAAEAQRAHVTAEMVSRHAPQEAYPEGAAMSNIYAMMVPPFPQDIGGRCGAAGGWPVARE